MTKQAVIKFLMWTETEVRGQKHSATKQITIDGLCVPATLKRCKRINAAFKLSMMSFWGLAVAFIEC
jgi:hypothetical protein